MRRKLLWTAGAVVVTAAGLLAWDTSRAPDAVWAPVPVPLDIKPWAHARTSPGGPHVGCDSWFVRADGGHAPEWSPDLLIELEELASPPRRAVQQLSGASHYGHVTVARYRLAPERAELDGATWARYVRAD